MFGSLIYSSIMKITWIEVTTQKLIRRSCHTFDMRRRFLANVFKWCSAMVKINLALSATENIVEGLWPAKYLLDHQGSIVLALWIQIIVNVVIDDIFCLGCTLIFSWVLVSLSVLYPSLYPFSFRWCYVLLTGVSTIWESSTTLSWLCHKNADHGHGHKLFCGLLNICALLSSMYLG